MYLVLSTSPLYDLRRAMRSLPPSHAIVSSKLLNKVRESMKPEQTNDESIVKVNQVLLHYWLHFLISLLLHSLLLVNSDRDCLQ